MQELKRGGATPRDKALPALEGSHSTFFSLFMPFSLLILTFYQPRDYPLRSLHLSLQGKSRRSVKRLSTPRETPQEAPDSAPFSSFAANSMQRIIMLGSQLLEMSSQ